MNGYGEKCKLHVSGSGYVWSPWNLFINLLELILVANSVVLIFFSRTRLNGKTSESSGFPLIDAEKLCLWNGN